MTLEQRKLKAELLRVQAAKADMEYRIAERLDEITRIEANIKVQEETELKIIEKMKEKKEE